MTDMRPVQEYHDSIIDAIELNLALTSKTVFRRAFIYVDTGREPKMWDINTPMPVKGDSQILAHVDFTQKKRGDFKVHFNGKGQMELR